ncbi:tight adherence protein B [Paraoerskovia marina]|uniref:Tight adherence protein B n=1 Tax=Paraoerskovia marina TaxID=545619 RepID=A0A1H1UHM8_9CELL|nr:type II secretion system F family protein [Paraoerskovia marina]SDS71938.1 tight adherence protein B [Paraoerskovia marina]
MGVVVGLLLGAGCCLVWLSCWTNPAARSRTRGWTARVQDMLSQAGLPDVTPGALLGVSSAAGLAALAVVFAVTRSITISVCFAAMAGAAPWLLVRGQARRRRVRLRDVWAEAVDHLASGVRAGLSLPEALVQLGERGPDDLREPFRRFGQDYRSAGRFGEALDALKARLADPVGDRIVEALRVTRDVGGADLGRMLRTLSGFLREDARTRGELEARQSWTINGARVAVAGPWVVLGLLATRPETAAAFDSVTGALVLAGGAACSLVAYRAMVHIGRLPDEERVLR